jgi:hypothetical protein
MTQLLPEGSEISLIKGGTSGVYLLEKITGSILRLFLNTKGFYELDTEFSCMPGTYGLVTITKLLDFVMLPANSENFKIMAIDAQGNLLYCQPGEPPVSNTLTLPPGGWGSIARMVYANESLYIADADKSNVWIYDGSSGATSGMSGIIFAESPVQFFDETIPDLGGAIAMAINQEDLFILHGDGHMTLCQYSALKEAKLTECEDPAPYTDNRFGSENKKPWIFMGTNFMDMQYVKLPNASLLVLDGISGTLYKFSLQLNLEQTLKLQANPDYPIPTTAPTGFGVTQDKELFLAFSNQIFSAPLQ